MELRTVCAGRARSVKDRGRRKRVDPDRCGTLVSSGIGGLPAIVREQERGLERGFDRVSPFFIPMSIANMAAGRLAIESGFTGYCSCVVTACASGANALGDAMRMIRHGYADVMLCGGAESTVIPLAVGGFTAMRALHEGSDPKPRLYPLRRCAQRLCSGGRRRAVLILEEYGHARRRGARIYAEHPATAPPATRTTSPRRSLPAAARRGPCGLHFRTRDFPPLDPGYINAHGNLHRAERQDGSRCRQSGVRRRVPLPDPRQFHQVHDRHTCWARRAESRPSSACSRSGGLGSPSPSTTARPIPNAIWTWFRTSAGARS